MPSSTLTSGLGWPRPARSNSASRTRRSGDSASRASKGAAMDIGIGLPSTIPGIPGRLVPEWAAAAERAGFSTLGTIDRVVYANFETVPTLAAAAAVTERIRLTTSILIAPYRGNGAVLAKQLATVDNLAGGRLTVGIAVGGRQDDFTS